MVRSPRGGWGTVTWQPSPRRWWGTVFPGVGNDKGGGGYRANKCEKLPTALQCFCNSAHLHIWEQGGTVTVRGGHFCLLPVAVEFDGKRLGSKDPLPLAGHACRDAAVDDLTELARLLNVPMPNLTCMLPRDIFDGSGDMLSYVQRIATQLSEVAVVRLVNKSPGTMWGFCRKLIWDQTSFRPKMNDSRPLEYQTATRSGIQKLRCCWLPQNGAPARWREEGPGADQHLSSTQGGLFTLGSLH